MAAPTCTTDDTVMVWHCETCEWWKCPECEATYDVERGVRVTRGGKVEAL